MSFLSWFLLYQTFHFFPWLDVTKRCVIDVTHVISKGGSKSLEASKMELFLAVFNGSNLLTFVTKSSILDKTWIDMARYGIWLHLRYVVSYLLSKRWFFCEYIYWVKKFSWKTWAEISQMEIGLNICGFFCFTKQEDLALKDQKVTSLWTLGCHPRLLYLWVRPDIQGREDRYFIHFQMQVAGQ